MSDIFAKTIGKDNSQTAGNFSAQSLPKESPAKPRIKDGSRTNLLVDHAKEDSVTQAATEEISTQPLLQILQMRKQILLRVNQQN